MAVRPTPAVQGSAGNVMLQVSYDVIQEAEAHESRPTIVRAQFVSTVMHVFWRTMPSLMSKVGRQPDI